MAEDPRAEPTVPQIPSAKSTGVVSKIGPDTRETTAIPQKDIINAQLTQLLAKVNEGFAHSDARFDAQDRKIDILVDDKVAVTTRLDRIDVKLVDVTDRVVVMEKRADSNSMRAKSASQIDLEQASQLAQEKAAREALAASHAALNDKVDGLVKTNAAQTVILQRITALLDTKLGKAILYGLGALSLAMITAATGYFARGSEAKQQPATIIMQAPVAPAASK